MFDDAVFQSLYEFTNNLQLEMFSVMSEDEVCHRFKSKGTTRQLACLDRKPLPSEATSGLGREHLFPQRPVPLTAPMYRMYNITAPLLYYL